MDRYAQLKEKFLNRQQIYMANLYLLKSPFMLRAFENADCVLLDKEHGLYGTEELVPLTNQCRFLGIPSIVRVEDAQYHLIAKAIDLGADGIMVPRVETLEQVKMAVDAMHFAPIGRTGCGGWGKFREGETFEEFQKGRILLLQIESPKGLAAMESMIAEYGEYIDGFIVGPNDYSIIMGVPRQLDHPLMLAEYEKFYAICKKYGKSCGIFDPDLEHAERDQSMGANVFWLSDDLSCMKAGFDALVQGVKSISQQKS